MTHLLLSPVSDASISRFPANPPSAPARDAAATGAVHVLAPGQSPAEVATLHGVTEYALRAENELGPGQAVYPGTVLRIPAQPMPDQEGGEHVDAAGLRPFDPGSDDAGGAESGTSWTPDFKSMSPADIQRYLESPEFRQMAASEREAAERLFHAGMKQTAAEYLASRIKHLPPEVAARLAEACKALIGQLAREAAGDKEMYAVLARMATQLVRSPAGQALLGEFAREMAGAMSDQEVRKFLQSIHQGEPGSQLMHIMVLKALLARVDNGSLRSVQALELRNAVSEQINQVYQGHKSAQAEKAAKDKEFASMLARLGHSLTDAQKQALYRTFVNDTAAYEQAARMAALMAGVASVAAGDVTATLLNRYELSEITQLVDGLARGGQGTAALDLLLALKGNPKAVERLDPATLQQLEQLAAAAALAEAAAATGDVHSGLERVLGVLQRSVADADSLIGKLNKMLTTLEELAPDRSNSARVAAELSELLEQAGPWANVIGGLLSMAVALTSTSGTQFDASFGALIDGLAATVGTASDIVSILSGLAAPESLLEADFANVSKVLGVAGKVLGVLSNSVEVAKSIQHMVENGAPNGGDITSMIGALVGIGAAIAGTGPVGAVLALASMVILMAGEMIRNHDKEQELLAQFTEYLRQIGIDPTAARNLLRNPITSQRLASLGLDAGQIQRLAKHAWLFDGGWGEFGFMRLATALKHAGLGPASLMELAAGMGADGLRTFCEALANDISLQDAFAQVTDLASLRAALAHAVATMPAGQGREAAAALLNQIPLR